jgi:hypothetical protein
MRQFRMHKTFLTITAGVFTCLAALTSQAQTTRTWAGAANGDWFKASNWIPSDSIPANGENVIITNTSVVLSNTTAELGSFTITNATLTFTNWNTALRSTNVTIRSSGILTHYTNAATATNALGQWVADNRVWVVCSNLVVTSNGMINAYARGYMGALSASLPAGRGPGGGLAAQYGGGYGGFGGRYQGNASLAFLGQPYGSASAPTDPGSGGAWNSAGNPGQTGGGAIRIEATNVCINGTLNANGGYVTSAAYDGMGSGGSVYITCSTFAGTNGLVTSDGGYANPNIGWNYKGGGGGGGRIAILYNPIAQSNLNLSAGRPTVLISASPGQVAVMLATPGTLFFTDDQILPTVIRGGQYLNFTSWTTPSLMVSNGWAIFPTNLSLNVAGSLSIWGSLSTVVMSNPASVIVGGDLMVTNASTLSIYSRPTNGVTEYGTFVNANSLVISTNSFLYPYSDPTNGGSVYFTLSNLSVQAGGTIDASGKGFMGGTTSYGYGPGGGQYNVGGGGYGGKGNSAATVNGTNFGWTYGSSLAPTDPGSGGGGTAGGAGGGLVRMQITNTAFIAGSILANGTGATLGGSGGGINLTARRFAISAGTLKAEGGSGSAKGGGGGRIALTGHTYDSGGGTLSVAPGGSGTTTGLVGTIVRQMNTGDWKLLVEGRPQRHGAITPCDYGTNLLANGTVTTNTITLYADEAAGMRYACSSWSLSNAAGPVASGLPPEVIVTADSDLFLNVYWTNQYYLSTTTIGSGSLAADKTGWYTNGLSVEITAVPAGGNEFLQWIGVNVPSDALTQNPLTVTMDRPRDLKAVFVTTGSAVTRVLTANNNWFATASWSPVGIPAPGDSVIIRSGNCLLSDPARIASLVVSNGATLTSSNWNSTIQAQSIVIHGTVTHSQNSAVTTNALGAWVQDAGVFLKCTNFLLSATGKILGDGLGFKAGGAVRQGCGPGGGKAPTAATRGGGGAYGGWGGKGNDAAYSVPYGLASAPAEPGSGGGAKSDGTAGGNGGGYARIEVSEHAVVNGAITMNGITPGGDSGGGGSGGGVWLSCRTFASTNGLISANAGNATAWGGGGGGGRIALQYDPAAQAALASRPTLRLSVKYGFGSGFGDSGDHGTLYMTDYQSMPDIMLEWNGRPTLANGTSWAPNNLVLSNGWMVFPTNFTIFVTNDLAVISTGRLDFAGSELTCGNLILTNGGSLNAYRGTGTTDKLTVTNNVFLNNGTLLYMYALSNPLSLSIGGNLSLTNGGKCYLFSGPTNSTVDYGGLLDLSGRNLLVPTNCILYPAAHPTNGGGILMRMNNLTVPLGGWINGDTNGFLGGLTGHPVGYGPGGGGSTVRGAGGGHGGKGGNGNDAAVGGVTNDSPFMPLLPGSGGGAKDGGVDKGAQGGSLVRIVAANRVTLDGTISANGGAYPAISDSAGGGAGGSIFITCKTMAGDSTGKLLANGGPGAGMGGGGGGGRIAVWAVYSNYLGTATVTGGVAGVQSGSIGTVYWKMLPPGGTIIVIR